MKRNLKMRSTFADLCAPSSGQGVWIKTACAAAFAFVLAAVACPQSVVHHEPSASVYVQLGTLNAMQEATTIPALDAVRSSVVVTDFMVEIGYALRLLDLGEKDRAETIILKTIPANAIEFNILLVIPWACKNHGIDLRKPVCNLPDHYLYTLSRIVARRPLYYPSFLTLSVFGTGYVKTDLEHFNEELASANPEAYRKALRALSPAVRRYVCGDCTKDLGH
jgi:hypothetical protein